MSSKYKKGPAKNNGASPLTIRNQEIFPFKELFILQLPALVVLFYL